MTYEDGTRYRWDEMKGVKGKGQVEAGRHDVRGLYTYGSDCGTNYPEDEEDE